MLKRARFCDGVVERRDDVADVAVAVAVEHLEDDQARARRDAAARAIRIVAVAGDDPGDVRAVAVVVVRERLEVDEVHEMDDAIGAEVVVPGGDAGVDDRDADARAVDAEVRARPASPRSSRRSAPSSPPRADRGGQQRLQGRRRAGRARRRALPRPAHAATAERRPGMPPRERMRESASAPSAVSTMTLDVPRPSCARRRSAASSLRSPPWPAAMAGTAVAANSTMRRTVRRAISQGA